MEKNVNSGNMSCEQLKAYLCDLIKKEDCDSLERLSNLNLLFSKLLTKHEADTFRKKFEYFFKDPLSGEFEISDKFVIDSNSLQKLVKGKKGLFLHFYFIHLNDGQLVTGNLKKYVNNLYYLIVVSSKNKLTPNHNYKQDYVYFVGADNKLTEIQHINFKTLKKDFRKGIGSKIIEITEIGNITEYITYKIEDVNTYLQKVTANEISLEMLCIDEDIVCVNNNCSNLKNFYEQQANRLFFAVYDDGGLINRDPTQEGADAGELNP